MKSVYLLKKILEAIGTNLDLDRVLKIICKELLDFFKADRVAIKKFPSQNDYSHLLSVIEFTTDEAMPEHKNLVIPLEVKEYLGKTLLDEGKDIIIDNIDDFNVPDFYKEFHHKLGTKSILNIPIKKEKDNWGILAISQNDHYRVWTTDEIEILHMVIEYIYLAIKKAEIYEVQKQTAERETILYETVKQQAEKELTLRKTIEVLRSSLDAEEIKKHFVEITGKYFDADRCLFDDYDKETGKFLPFRIERLKSPEIKSLVGIDTEKNFPEFLSKLKKGKNIIIKDLEKTLSRKKLISYRAVKTLSMAGTKSDYGFLVKYNDQIMGILIIHFVNQKRVLTHDELDFLKILRDQAGVALYQAELYNKTKQSAHKESVLREIVGNIKVSYSFKQIYNYILSKLSDIFDVDTALFIEISEIDPKMPVVKYEFNKNPDTPSIKDLILTKIRPVEIFTMMKNPFPIFINDIKGFHPQNLEIQEFFNTYNIKSILTAPIAKYKEEKIIFGLIILCSLKPKNWTKYEINLFEEILNSTANVIWEIMKRTEMDELRNTFILTLAHDLDVPLVGERRALEFIVKIPPGQLLDKYKDMIAEIIKDNINLSNFLKRLVDSYSYEMERKKLHFTKSRIEEVINDAIDSQKDYAKSKSILVKVDIQNNLPDINIDKEEIKKVISRLLENAITYSPEGGKVQVKCGLDEGKLTICVIDKGSGIPKEIQKRLFKRYEMALSIKRSIGAGIGLYLAKQIVEVHKGQIWYTTEIGAGTTFCFSLPCVDSV
jgi:signal transduction histidine kinase/transcriptional regulator with GAF, ATPase, and Fis domain